MKKRSATDFSKPVYRELKKLMPKEEAQRLVNSVLPVDEALRTAKKAKKTALAVANQTIAQLKAIDAAQLADVQSAVEAADPSAMHL